MAVLDLMKVGIIKIIFLWERIAKFITHINLVILLIELVIIYFYVRLISLINFINNLVLNVI